MTAAPAEPETFYWCLTHRRVEQGSTTTCPPDDRMGPYDSEDAATRWRERVDARNERWDKEDEAWEGDG
jgi:hypothetical protein